MPQSPAGCNVGVQTRAILAIPRLIAYSPRDLSVVHPWREAGKF